VRLAIEPPLDPGAYPFRHEIRTRFGETDAMGIVHHASYVLYMEEARVAYLRAVGHPYPSVRAEGIDFAVLEVFVRYRSPLRFDDEVTVHVALAHASRATFQIGYLLTVDGEPRATGVSVHGALDQEGRATRLPAWLGPLAGGWPTA
jgi:acyl-CoA thioester hydrolase